MVVRIPFREGLFADDGEGGVLLGGKCKSCKKIFFPPPSSCYECGSEDLETVTLSKRGKLYTYTISYMSSVNFQAPYALGYVELPEGVRLLANLEGWQGKPLKVGAEVELVLGTLWTEEDKEVIGYKFRLL